MKFRHNTSTLLCLLGASAFIHAAELPATVQFDVIFPRNDSIYKPVYPFPVVFGLTNGSAAWSYNIHWNSEIIALDRDQNTDILIANGGGFPGVSGIEKPAPPQDSHLIIDPVIQIVNTTSRRLLMRYDFGMINSCNESTGEVSPDPDPSVISSGFVTFGLDPENGDIPDLTNVGPCATPVASMRIEKEIVSSRGPCPILTPGIQPTNSCAIPLNHTLADQVAELMLQETQCIDQTWPNVTGLVRKCRPNLSGDTKLGGDGMLLFYVTVFAGFVIFSHM